MKTLTHTLWPVSYINDEGKQVDDIYNFNPSRAAPDLWVGEALYLTTSHADNMQDTAKEAKIAELKAKLAKLEAGE